MTKRTLSALAFALVLAYSIPAFADTTYTYTGDNYSFVYGSEYTTADALGGFVTFANPLAPGDFTFSYASLLFSFYDGAHTIDSTNATSGFLFFSVNSVGAITEWAFAFASPDSSIGSCEGCFLSGDAVYAGGTHSGAFATPGTWQVTAVPEPSAILMLGMTALGLVGTLRRRFAA